SRRASSPPRVVRVARTSTRPAVSSPARCRTGRGAPHAWSRLDTGEAVMKLRAMLCLLVVTAALAGCAGTSAPGEEQFASADRPVLETPPATEHEQAAMVHIDLGTAYFEVGRYDVA